MQTKDHGLIVIDINIHIDIYKLISIYQNFLGVGISKFCSGRNHQTDFDICFLNAMGDDA